MLTLGILDIAPEGNFSFSLEKKTALNNMKFHQVSKIFHVDEAISPK